MSELTELVDKLLTENRPDRYELDGGDDWLEAIERRIAPKIDAKTAQARQARTIVRTREGEKVRSTHRILREIVASKQPPLGWLDMKNMPLPIGKERVALRAATAGDFRRFATDERRVAANEFAGVNATCEAAEKIADSMDERGLDFGRELFGREIDGGAS